MGTSPSLGEWSEHPSTLHCTDIVPNPHSEAPTGTAHVSPLRRPYLSFWDETPWSDPHTNPTTACHVTSISSVLCFDFEGTLLPCLRVNSRTVHPSFWPQGPPVGRTFVRASERAHERGTRKVPVSLFRPCTGSRNSCVDWTVGKDPDWTRSKGKNEGQARG